MSWWNALLRTRETGWIILVRLLVGLVVFFPEGLQKLLFPAVLGAGRFAKIGIPYPDLMGPFVGVVETVCGLLIILGLCTRLATIPLLVVMGVAILSTKVPILLGHDLGPFHLAADIKRVGFWSAQHEARADLTMALGLLFLLIVGAGRWSMDAWLTAPHPSPSNRGRS
ncbi:DoxX family protein [Methylobacterium sp.]|uniref:DoxX family protein n=1 Tax=Methylobacterium sp. TaxID=409 RepID=UPI000C42DDF7|nr:DoxX family protein [Methylobacterium sp.]MBP29032.1 DoxX family protein [Methylobacterium sp.]